MEPKTHLELEVIRSKKANTFYKVKDNYKTVTKNVDMAKRVVQSVPNTYLFFDNDCDVLMPGCAAKTINENGPDSTGNAKIKNVKDHVISDRIGKPLILDEREVDNRKVMYGESRMLNTTLGDDTLIEYQEGVIDQHSIGFQYVNLELVTADDDMWSKYLALIINPKDAEACGYMFLVNEIKMYEWSPVSFGANELSPYLGVKSGNKEGYILKIHNRFDLLEKQLRSGKQSDLAMLDYELEIKQLKQIIGELFLQEPSIKDTLAQRRLQEDTKAGTSLTICPSCLVSFNYETGTKNAKCTNCGKYCFPGQQVIESSFDWGKALKETTFINI